MCVHRTLSLTLTLSTLNSAVDSAWSSPALLRAIEAESVGNDLAYAIPLLQEAGLARVKPLREGSIIQITDAGIRTPHAKRIMNLAREGGTLDEAYYLECRDLEVAHAARTDTEKARQRAKLAMEHELAKLKPAALIERAAAADSAQVITAPEAGVVVSATADFLEVKYYL